MKSSSVLLLILPLLFFFGCGRSPLLNHNDELSSRTASTQDNDADANCLLRFVRQGSVLCANFKWELGPVVGENRIRIDFSSEFGSIADVAFWAYMPDMGHGTAPVTLASDGDLSVVVSDLWLIMAGRWVLHLRIGTEENEYEVRL